MKDATLIGIDLGKHAFHLHGQGRHGNPVLSKKFNRRSLIEFMAQTMERRDRPRFVLFFLSSRHLRQAT